MRAVVTAKRQVPTYDYRFLYLDVLLIYILLNT